MQCACAILLSVANPAVQYFSTLSHKRHNFGGKKLLNIKCALIFSTTFVWNISHSKNSARYYHKSTQVFKWSIRGSRQILTKLKFSRQIFEKYSNIKLYENPFSCSWVVSCGRAANSRFSQICESATPPETESCFLTIQFQH